jgi:hypothetical protein
LQNFRMIPKVRKLARGPATGGVYRRS